MHSSVLFLPIIYCKLSVSLDSLVAPPNEGQFEADMPRRRPTAGLGEIFVVVCVVPPCQGENICTRHFQVLEDILCMLTSRDVAAIFFRVVSAVSAAYCVHGTSDLAFCVVTYL